MLAKVWTGTCGENFSVVATCRERKGEGVAITTKFLMTEDERKGECISYELACDHCYTCLVVPVLFSGSWNPQSCVCADFKMTTFNRSAWGHLNPSSYCDVGRLFYGVFKLWSKLQRKK